MHSPNNRRRLVHCAKLTILQTSCCAHKLCFPVWTALVASFCAFFLASVCSLRVKILTLLRSFSLVIVGIRLSGSVVIFDGCCVHRLVDAWACVMTWLRTWRERQSLTWAERCFGFESVYEAQFTIFTFCCKPTCYQLCLLRTVCLRHCLLASTGSQLQNETSKLQSEIASIDSNVKDLEKHLSFLSEVGPVLDCFALTHWFLFLMLRFSSCFVFCCSAVCFSLFCCCFFIVLVCRSLLRVFHCDVLVFSDRNE